MCCVTICIVFNCTVGKAHTVSSSGGGGGSSSCSSRNSSSNNSSGVLYPKTT
jgi:hypothetical protein